ncbi:MAG TPA: transcriptional repressor LexA [Opitutaceae bacterium]|nr:transcriptional repressor LexA [Opitutaceae bacterium]
MLTERQQKILDFVLRTQSENGAFPTLREIQAHFGFASPFAVTRHLQALEKKGMLKRQPGKSRSFISPAGFSTPATRIPLYGTIPAGLPTAAEQQPDSYVGVDLATLGIRQGTTVYALQVRGDSMVGANIIEGDLVFLTPKEPRPRDIVAALIDGESTLKRFLLQRGQPFLRAENPRYPDLIPANELFIQGVMVGLLRRQT